MTMRTILVVLTLLCATGCSNTLHSGLMNSNSIMLPPSGERTVYIQVRNTSENQQITLSDLGNRLKGKGYQVVTDPTQAAYWLQTRVVYCHKAGAGVKPEAVAQSGFGSGIGSGGAPLPTGNGGVDGMPGMGRGGMPGMMGGMGGMPDINALMAQAMRGGYGAPPPKEEGATYLCIADVQVTDRGQSGMPLPSTSAVGSPKTYQMRSVAHVLQKDVSVEEATPIIQDKLSTGITGPF
jgi:hypothetical protein